MQDNSEGAAVQKDPAAFRTIREVSDMLGLPQHVLRFWETRFPELKPLQRGGNRRYYRPADVAFAMALRKLLHDNGYTVKGVRKLISAYGAKNLVAVANGEPVAPRRAAAASVVPSLVAASVESAGSAQAVISIQHDDALVSNSSVKAAPPEDFDLTRVRLEILIDMREELAAALAN